MTKISICVPSGDMLHADFAFSLATMCSFTLLYADIKVVSLINKKGTLITQSRCELVKDAKSTGADKMLFLDSDHVFPRDTLIRLAKPQKDIIACVCTTKRPPLRSNCVGADGKWVAGKRTGLEQVQRVGTAIMLIDLKVFDNMEKPYFNFIYDQTYGWMGEDFYFCKKATEKGYKIFVDHDLSNETEHIGPCAFGMKDFAPIVEQKEKRKVSHE
jgi:hypothetical protein